MICALCKTEIESDPQIRNEHSYHECCAMTWDKDEQFIEERDSESQWFSKKDVVPYPIEPKGKSSFLKSDKKPKKAKYKIYLRKSMDYLFKSSNQASQALIVLLVK